MASGISAGITGVGSGRSRCLETSSKSSSQMRQVSCSESGVSDEAFKGLGQGLDGIGEGAVGGLGTAIPGREAPASREPSCGPEREDPIRHLAPCSAAPTVTARVSGSWSFQDSGNEAGASLPGGSWLVGLRRSLARYFFPEDATRSLGSSAAFVPHRSTGSSARCA